MTEHITDRGALALYCRVWGETMPDPGVDLDDRERDIADEVREMRSAKSLDDAVNVVAWWLSRATSDEERSGLRAEVARLRRMKVKR